MQPVQPSVDLTDKDRRITFGVGQEKDYLPLPAVVDTKGTIITEWELSAEDIDRIMRKGATRVRLTLMYMDLQQPLPPQLLEVVGETV